MKKIILVIILASVGIGAFAQNGKKDKMDKKHKMHHNVDHEAHAMMYADKMTTRLNLTLIQKEKIQQAQMERLDNQKEMMAEMISENGNMGSENEKMREEKRNIQQNFREEMKDILTPEQFNNWEPMHKREMKMQGKKNKMKDKNKSKAKNKLEDDY